METVKEYFEKTLRHDLHLKGPELPDVKKVFFEAPLGEQGAGPFELLVGRKDELEALSFSLSQAMKGLYKKIIIEGESGAGKTSILHLVGSTVFSVHPDCAVVYFPEDSYFKTLEEIKFGVLTVIMRLYLGSRAGGHEKEALAMDELTRCYLRTSLLELKEEPALLSTIFAKHGLCNENEDPIKKYFDKLNNKKLLFLFDTADKLVEQKLILSGVEKLIETVNGLALFAFFPESVSTLQKKNDNLIKNCQIVRLKKFTEQECKEILRRRLLFGKGALKDITNEPNYAVDLQPFTETIVGSIARIVAYNPLRFIQKLKVAVSCARENNYEVIDERCLEPLLKDVSTVSRDIVELTRKQREVYDFVKAEGPVTTETARKKMGVKSRVSAFLMLDRLVEKNLITKQREGRKVIFSVTEDGAK